MKLSCKSDLIAEIVVNLVDNCVHPILMRALAITLHICDQSQGNKKAAGC